MDRKVVLMNEKRRVKFVIHAPDARDVFLSGTFSNWDKVPMMRIKGGLWEATVEMTPGKYEYHFFMDGQQVDDVPGCVQVDEICVQDVPAAKRVSNSFGSKKCLLVV